MNYVVETESLCKDYGRSRALCNLSMKVPKGAVYGFVGANGAGKTTLIRLLCGLQEPTAGSYTLYGVKNREAGIGKARRRIGAVVETPSVYLDMTAAARTIFWNSWGLEIRERKKSGISPSGCGSGWGSRWRLRDRRTA